MPSPPWTLVSCPSQWSPVLDETCERLWSTRDRFDSVLNLKLKDKDRALNAVRKSPRALRHILPEMKDTISDALYAASRLKFGDHSRALDFTQAIVYGPRIDELSAALGAHDRLSPSVEADLPHEDALWLLLASLKAHAGIKGTCFNDIMTPFVRLLMHEVETALNKCKLPSIPKGKTLSAPSSSCSLHGSAATLPPIVTQTSRASLLRTIPLSPLNFVFPATLSHSHETAHLKEGPESKLPASRKAANRSHRIKRTTERASPSSLLNSRILSGSAITATAPPRKSESAQAEELSRRRPHHSEASLPTQHRHSRYQPYPEPFHLHPVGLDNLPSRARVAYEQDNNDFIKLEDPFSWPTPLYTIASQPSSVAGSESGSDSDSWQGLEVIVPPPHWYFDSSDDELEGEAPPTAPAPPLTTADHLSFPAPLLAAAAGTQLPPSRSSRAKIEKWATHLDGMVEQAPVMDEQEQRQVMEMLGAAYQRFARLCGTLPSAGSLARQY